MRPSIWPMVVWGIFWTNMMSFKHPLNVILYAQCRSQTALKVSELRQGKQVTTPQISRSSHAFFNPIDYRKYTSHIPLVLSYIAAGIFPLATVLFMAANERTRRFWKTPFHQLRSYISRHTSSSHVTSQLINDDNSERQLTNKSA